MRLVKNETSRWCRVLILLVLILLMSSLLLAACQSSEETVPADAQPCEKEAAVDSVEVEEKDGEYYAIVSGTYTDACTKTDTITQEVAGDTIHMTVCTTRPEGMLCAQVLAPYEEEIPLDTQGLSSGEYTVDANGVTTTFSIP